MTQINDGNMMTRDMWTEERRRQIGEQKCSGEHRRLYLGEVQNVNTEGYCLEEIQKLKTEELNISSLIDWFGHLTEQ